MTNTIIICHVLTPPATYEKFIVGSQPMRMREYTAVNNNIVYYAEKKILTNHVKFTLSLYKTCPFDLVQSSEYRIQRRYSCFNCGPCYSWHPAAAQSNSLIWHRFPLQDQPNTLLKQTSCSPQMRTEPCRKYCKKW